MPPIPSPVEAQFVSSSMPVDDAVDSAVSTICLLLYQLPAPPDRLNFRVLDATDAGRWTQAGLVFFELRIE